MLFIGIHVGHEATRALIADAEGTVVAAASVAHSAPVSNHDWHEHEPNGWWDAVVGALRQLVATLGSRSREIKAVGLSGEPDTAVLLDRMAQVVRPAMVGGPALVTKLEWVRENEPEAFGKIAQVLSAKDFIRFKMSGVYATDPSQAVNEPTINPAWLPAVQLPHAVTSQVIPGIGALTGIPMWIPIVAGTTQADGDGTAAAALAAQAVK